MADPTSYLDTPIKAFTHAGMWREFLKVHHDSMQGVWVKLYNKGSGVQSLTYAEALDEALCYGWIDGQVKKLIADSTWRVQRFTPRRPKSIWSTINKGHVARLIREGRMTAAGQRVIDAAKADGRWDAAYASSSTFVLPPEFVMLLEQYPQAKEFYQSLTKANQYAIYWRIHTAKRPETKAKRMQDLLAMLIRREMLH